MNPTIQGLLNHRSIRKYTDQPVTDEQLHWIIQSAQAASTSSFLQAFSVISVSKGENREQLAQLCGDQKYVAAAPVFLVFCADLNRLHLACDMMGTNYQGGWTEHTLIGSVDAAIAGQNALVAAESMGLGGVYIGGIRNNPTEVSALLKLPTEVFPVFGLCIGYPAESPGVKERLPQPFVLHHEHYTPLDAPELQEMLNDYDQRIREYYIQRTGGRVTESWRESVSEKLSKEMRPHMLSYLQDQELMIK